MTINKIFLTKLFSLLRKFVFSNFSCCCTVFWDYLRCCRRDSNNIISSACFCTSVNTNFFLFSSFLVCHDYKEFNNVNKFYINIHIASMIIDIFYQIYVEWFESLRVYLSKNWYVHHNDEIQSTRYPIS